MAGEYREQGSCTAQRTSHVEEQVGRLGSQIERALSLKCDLESRLSGVLRNDSPVATLDKPKEPVSLVPLATALSEYNLKLNVLCDRLESILNRLEV